MELGGACAGEEGAVTASTCKADIGACYGQHLLKWDLMLTELFIWPMKGDSDRQDGTMTHLQLRTGAELVSPSRLKQPTYVLVQPTLAHEEKESLLSAEINRNQPDKNTPRGGE